MTIPTWLYWLFGFASATLLIQAGTVAYLLVEYIRGQFRSRKK